MSDILKRTTAWLREMLSHILTGPDGVTMAIGRVMAIPYALVGWALPYVMLATHQAFTLGEAGVFLAAHAAGVWPLVTGTNSTEPKPPGGA